MLAINVFIFGQAEGYSLHSVILSTASPIGFWALTILGRYHPQSNQIDTGSKWIYNPIGRKLYFI